MRPEIPDDVEDTAGAVVPCTVVKLSHSSLCREQVSLNSSAIPVTLSKKTGARAELQLCLEHALGMVGA